jgi:large subunit ribosomal protein L10
MPRPEKVAAVAEVKERIERAQAVFLAEYAGLSVKAQQELRRGLRAEGAEFRVLKMTLARRAAGELELEALDDLLVGPTGITFADGDPVSAAKVLKDFAAAHEVFAIKGGLLGRDILTSDRVKALAEIAPREVLLAQLAGAFKAPLTAMAGLLGALPRGAVTAMQQLLEKKQAAAPVAAEAPVSEAAVGETAAPADDEAPEADSVSDAEPEDAEAGASAAADAPEAAASPGEADEPEATNEAETPEASVPGAAEAVDAPSSEASVDDATGEDDTPAAARAAAEDPEAPDDPAATAEEE